MVKAEASLSAVPSLSLCGIGNRNYRPVVGRWFRCDVPYGSAPRPTAQLNPRNPSKSCPYLAVVPPYGNELTGLPCEVASSACSM